MYWVECQCKFRGTWTEVDGIQQPYDSVEQAIYAARVIRANRRSPTRVIDYLGNVVWEVQ